VTAKRNGESAGPITISFTPSASASATHRSSPPIRVPFTARPKIVPAQCVPPARAPRPPGTDWVGCGSGFAAYGDMGFERVYPEIHPGAAAVARLAAPRLAAGEGIDAARAAPVYLRDKVALTTEERRNR